MYTFAAALWLGGSLARADLAYTLELNSSRLPLKAGLEHFAERADKNGDRFLSDAELQAFMKQSGRPLDEWKYAFTNTRLPERTLYPDVEEVGAHLQALAQRLPGRAERVSLGKSHENRDIWALRVGTGDRAVMVTGGIHAREWATVAIALRVAEALVAQPPENAEVWIVPVVNPDGYEYSRNHDNNYRKNRRPGAGVDLNRNFSDPARPHVYRSPQDRPDSTKDDVGASDRPESELYRGPAGNSEPETQALVRFQLQRRVLAVLDNHSFGNMLLRPASSQEARYRRLAEVMNAAAGNVYKFQSSDELYKMSGNSMEFHEANGILSVTLESGSSFQPPQAELEKVLAYAVPANLAFVRTALQSAGSAGTSRRASP